MVAKKKKKKETQNCPVCLPLTTLISHISRGWMVFHIPWDAAHKGQHLSSTVLHLSLPLAWGGYAGSELTGETLPSCVSKCSLRLTHCDCQHFHVSIGRAVSQRSPTVSTLHSYASCDTNSFTLHRMQHRFRALLSGHRSQESNVTVHNDNVDMPGHFLQVYFQVYPFLAVHTTLSRRPRCGRAFGFFPTHSLQITHIDS